MTSVVTPPPRVSVVVPVYNRIRLTRPFLQLFTTVTYPNFEIIVVDDGSTDGTAQVIRDEFPTVRLIEASGNLWWSQATNMATQDALNRGSDLILTMNDDVTFNSDFLEKLVRTALDNPHTLVGAIIYEHSHPDRLWYAGGRMAWLAGDIMHRRGLTDGPLLWLTGMGTLIPAEVFSTIGFYDATHFPQYAADLDFSMRARKAGFSLMIQPESVIWNRGEESAQFLLRKNVRISTLWDPLFSLRSDSLLKMRLTLYWRYWPKLLIPIALAVYYAKVFAKQALRLVGLKK